MITMWNKQNWENNKRNDYNYVNGKNKKTKTTETKYCGIRTAKSDLKEEMNIHLPPFFGVMGDNEWKTHALCQDLSDGNFSELCFSVFLC